MLENLLTEQQNPASASIDALPTEDALRIINAEDRKIADAVEREIPAIARAVDAAVAAIEGGGRLFYLGAGTSGRLGVLDASECPPTFSVPPEMVQGIMAGGEAALSRATPKHYRRRPGHRSTRPAWHARIHRGRCARWASPPAEDSLRARSSCRKPNAWAP